MNKKEIKQLVALLSQKENLEVLHTMAFMSYNPSIGRVLEKKGVKKFSKFAEQIIDDLSRTHSQKEFDSYHHKWLQTFQNRIKTNQGKRCSIGQAQKAINVFLKLYYDWGIVASTAYGKNIRKYLHVPLDSYLMKFFKEKFRNSDIFKTVSHYSTKNHIYSNNSLSYIREYKQYFAWQAFFRSLYPKRPILFDIVWALERLDKK